MEAITTTYREVEITLLETENKWRFTVNGRERTAERVVKARESIDRALDDVKSKKEKTWQPFDAYFNPRYGNEEFKKVMVTSVAERGKYENERHLWIKDGKSRSKESRLNLFKICPENDALIAEILRLEAGAKAIDKKMGEAHKKLIKIEIPKETS